MTPSDRDATVSRTVWDLPTRLFHWILVVLLIFSYVAAEFNAVLTPRVNAWLGLGLEDFELHFYSGYTILALIVFRVLWGLVGSDTARFGSFVKGPRAAIGHVAHLFLGRPEPDEGPGHNPVGGWMVVVLLFVVWLQAFSGLFTTDDLLVDGPLAYAVSSDTRGDMSTLHRQNFYVLIGIAGLHVLAVVAYWVIWRRNLIKPMITGRKRLPAGEPAPETAPLAAALLVLAVAVAIVAGCIRFGASFAS